MTRIFTAVLIIFAGCSSSGDGPGALGLEGKGEVAGTLSQSETHTFFLTGQKPADEAELWSEPRAKALTVKINLLSAVLNDTADNWPMGGPMLTGLDIRLLCDEDHRHCPDGLAAWPTMENGKLQPEIFTGLEDAKNLRVWVRLPLELQTAMKNDPALGHVQVDLTVEGYENDK